MVVEKKGSGDSIGAQMIVARWVAIHSALEDKRADVRFGSLADNHPANAARASPTFWRISLSDHSAVRSAFLTVGDGLQACAVTNSNPLPTAFDDAGRFPCAHDAADRMQRGCSHLSDVLSAQWKINQCTDR